MSSSSTLAPGLAILFDMDGVIIDSMALHTHVWEVYVERLGWTRANIGMRMLGKRNDEILRDFGGGTLSEAEIAAHGAAKEALYRETMLPVFEQKLIPGVREFLRKLDGVPCGLGTNAEPLNVDFVLEHAGIRDRFRTIVDGHQVANPKPAPDVYLEAARRMGVEPANCVIFEDSPGGLAAARASGGRVVCVETSLRDQPDVELSIKDFNDPKLWPWMTKQRAVVAQ